MHGSDLMRLHFETIAETLPSAVFSLKLHFRNVDYRKDRKIHEFSYRPAQ
jgi:hypothetical protein